MKSAQNEPSWPTSSYSYFSHFPPTPPSVPSLYVFAQSSPQLFFSLKTVRKTGKITSYPIGLGHFSLLQIYKTTRNCLKYEEDHNWHGCREREAHSCKQISSSWTDQGLNANVTMIYTQPNVVGIKARGHTCSTCREMTPRRWLPAGCLFAVNGDVMNTDMLLKVSGTDLLWSGWKSVTVWL